MRVGTFREWSASRASKAFIFGGIGAALALVLLFLVIARAPRGHFPLRIIDISVDLDLKGMLESIKVSTRETGIRRSFGETDGYLLIYLVDCNCDIATEDRWVIDEQEQSELGQEHLGGGRDLETGSHYVVRKGGCGGLRFVDVDGVSVHGVMPLSKSTGELVELRLSRGTVWEFELTRPVTVQAQVWSGGGADWAAASNPFKKKIADLTTRDLEKYHRKTFSVLNIVDGDTIDIGIPDGKYEHTTIRLLGIDTPETKSEQFGTMYFGPEAIEFATELALGKKVTVYLDKESSTRPYTSVTFCFFHAWFHKNARNAPYLCL